MLQRLELENFKAWKQANMRLAPLTGLFGANSSGKTSILQFLLLLKQTVESSDRALVLNFNGNFVELGGFKDILTNHSLDNDLQFKVGYKVEESFEAPVSKYESERIDRVFERTLGCRIANIANSFKVKTIYYEASSEPPHTEFLGSQLQKDGSYSLYSAKKESIAELIGDKTRRNKFYQFPNFNSTDPSILINDHSYETAVLESEIESLFNTIYYVGPLRESPKRIYSWGGERRSQLGNRGEFAIECILASRERGDEIVHNGTTYNLESYIAWWLRKLGMIHDFKVEAVTEGGRLFEAKVQLTPNAPYVLLTDVGFGVSQILPVLVLCYYTPKGSILLMEQPEIHLHPRIQAGLADVFIDALEKRGVQIILESHSEHLLRRLQRRIAEEKMSNDNAALYFCAIKDGYSELQDLDMDTFGNIKNWPDNFFGDDITELYKMSEAIAHRKQLAKLNGK